MTLIDERRGPFLVLGALLVGLGCGPGPATTGTGGAAGSGGTSGAGGEVSTGSGSGNTTSGAGGSSAGGAAGGSGGAGATSGAGAGGAGEACSGTGPAYVHGDLWAFWHNERTACDAQHKWLWACERRFGAGNCPVEAQRFSDCWNAEGDFPKTSWADSNGQNHPTPHSANYGVCQPPHFPEKNDPSKRPNNSVPCDTTTFDYDALRTTDPFHGNDWWAGVTSRRHLSLKVFAEGASPQADQGQTDALVVLSTNPGEQAAFTAGLANHSYPGHVRAGGCLPEVSGDDESPYPGQNVGAFFWLEVPAGQPVTIGASWIGPLAGDFPAGCVFADSIYNYPPEFSYHGVDGKPWLTSTPCWDLMENVTLEPGRHYLWDLFGLSLLPDCKGPPEELLSLVPEEERGALHDGTCSSM